MDRVIINMKNATDKELTIARSVNILKDFVKTRGDRERITISWEGENTAFAYCDKYKDGIGYRFTSD